MKLKSNYHTHTYRCGHALDNDEDYVQGAIEIGIKDLGFSDHVPFKELHFPGMRQDYEMLEDYRKSIKSLQEKYKDQITLHIGFEAEYVDEYIDEYKDLLKSKKIDYLICGQHCFLENNEQIWYNSYHHNHEMLTKYIDALIQAIRSGLFIYIAHPDHFMNGYRVWDDFAIMQSRRLLEEASKYNIPLEINVAGLRFAEYKHRTNGKGMPVENLYPYDSFWELASKYNIKGIIGIDAHRKNDFLDGIEKEAIEFANKHHIELIEKLDIDAFYKNKVF